MTQIAENLRRATLVKFGVGRDEAGALASGARPLSLDAFAEQHGSHEERRGERDRPDDDRERRSDGVYRTRGCDDNVVVRKLAEAFRSSRRKTGPKTAV